MRKSTREIIVCCFLAIFGSLIVEACSLQPLEDPEPVRKAAPEYEINLIPRSDPESRFLSELQSINEPGETSLLMGKNRMSGMYEAKLQKRNDDMGLSFVYFTDDSKEFSDAVSILNCIKPDVGRMVISRFSVKCEITKTGEPDIICNFSTDNQIYYKTNNIQNLIKLVEVINE